MKKRTIIKSFSVKPDTTEHEELFFDCFLLSAE